MPAHQTTDSSEAAGFFLQAYEKAEVLVLLIAKSMHYPAQVLYSLNDTQMQWWKRLKYFFFKCEKYFIVLYLRFYRCTFFLYGLTLK